MKPNLCPTREIESRRFNEIAAGAIRLPAPGSFFRKAVRNDDDLFGKHEGRIEADAELADERQVGLLITREAREIIERTAVSDRAEVVNQLLPGHADAIVGDL